VTPEQTDGIDLKAAAKRRLFERGLQWGAIGFASALVLLVILAEVGALPLAVVRTGGAILIWLCAVLVLFTATYAFRQRSKN
jgi:hypothetical protein